MVHLGEGDLDEAEDRATDLNADYTRTGRRPAAYARRIRPARDVGVIYQLEIRPGRLDCWIREDDGWYGHVHIDGADPNWYPAERLHPGTDPRAENDT